MREKKSVKFELIKAEESTDSKGKKIGILEGYASIFNNRDLGGDIVRKGAFSRTIEANNGTFPHLYYHDPTRPIGVATVTEDEKGLKFRSEISLETQDGRETFILTQMGALKGMSFGYDTVKKTWNEDTRTRELLEVKLYETSSVTFGMNPAAYATATGVKGLGAKKAALAAMAESVFERATDLKEMVLEAVKESETKNIQESLATLNQVMNDMMALRSYLEEMHAEMQGGMHDEMSEPAKEADSGKAYSVFMDAVKELNAKAAAIAA